MTAHTEPDLDEAKVEQFAGRLFDAFTGGAITLMIDVGHRTGLFEAAARGPATSAELAERAGLQERYVREWLSALATAHVFAYDPESATFTLPAEHAVCLTGPGAANLAPVSAVIPLLGEHLDEVATAFREGGGVPYERFRPRFTSVMDQLSRGLFDTQLVDGILPLTGELPERLAAGIRAADIGCGTGHAVNVLAAAFPDSTFVGYDISPEAIERARAEARDAGLANARFEVRDVAELGVEREYEAVFAFDAIHDLADPASALRNVWRALTGDGVFVMMDIKASSRLEDNIGSPTAPLLYTMSTLHCMTVSLARDGAGLGTCWGEQLARRMLADAGFQVLSVGDVPDDPLDVVYLCRKDA
ncbi:class I SAM-dependent methyltransferase [Thermoactinospora rubra]|uniref:class I SAM-dependent methyltransferase n=1 Tax=Thermoactinospora rubra TaxID=1088767 RepID=UPI000A113EFC|nr:class I SAM-dependent methyltransferase [Thermoactinospora rubra]